MPTLVCQNQLISCFEPHLAETTTTLKLKVAAAPPPSSAADHLGHWGFFLQTNSQESTNPLSNNYSSSYYSKLSPESLQLCTENLGSETGSDTASDCSSIFSATPPPSPASNSVGNSHRASADTLDACNHAKLSPSPAKSCREIKNFPPPLTTMSGSNSLQVRRRSDGGRLIIETVEGPFRNSYLHAERSGGRLKLCFAAAATDNADREEAKEEEEIMDNESDGEDAAEQEEEEIESEKEEYEIKEKFQRFSRCKEGSHGNKGLCSNWKPAIWVAIS